MFNGTYSVTRFIPKVSRSLLSFLAACIPCLGVATTTQAEEKHMAYIVSDIRIPFWDIMKRGIEHRAVALGYQLDVYSANNDAKREIKFVAKAIKDKVDGIIISPANSSAAATILRLAKRS